jgi:hypothetical protein
VRFAVAKQQGLDESIVAHIDDGWRDDDALSVRYRSALDFADAFLSNDVGSAGLLTDDGGFDDAQRAELVMGLGLFHGFSKALIALGCEPEPGTMGTTELQTPDTTRPWSSIDDGFAALESAISDAVPADVLALATARVRTLLGVETLPPGRSGPIADLADLFVVDAHAIDDALVDAVVGEIGAATTVGLFIALATADASARAERATA